MPRSKYPCGICNKGVMYSSIVCTSCYKWYHGRCLKLSKRYLVNLTETEIQTWECKSCCDRKIRKSDSIFSHTSSTHDLLSLENELHKKIMELHSKAFKLTRGDIIELIGISSDEETKIHTRFLSLTAAEVDVTRQQNNTLLEREVQQNIDCFERKSVTRPTIQTGGDEMEVEEDPYEFMPSPTKARKTRAKREAAEGEPSTSAVTDEELLARDARPPAIVTLAPPTEISSERFQTFKSSLVEVFRTERAQSLSLAHVVEFVNGAHSEAPYNEGEVSAAIERLTEANQVMHADGYPGFEKQCLIVGPYYKNIALILRLSEEIKK